MQYKTQLDISSLIWGIEHSGDFLLDRKLGYLDIENAVIDFADSTIRYTHTENIVVSDQSLITSGIFTQYDVKIDRLKVAAGVRFDRFEVKDLANDGATKIGGVLSPRLSLMYELLEDIQARVSYSQGYRAPQIFDEDLHIETSGSRQVIHKNDPDLKQETSHSIMASFDFNRQIGSVYTGFLVEGFYTKLIDAFANEIGEPDEDGRVIYSRINAEGGAVVRGVNMELQLRPASSISVTSGFTIQTSEFAEPQEDFDERRFFRTPNQYGYFAINYDVYRKIRISSTGNYTGRMLLPYFGTENPDGELRETDRFFDLGAKLSHTVKLNGASVEFSGGIKNIFNSYQDDFDIGADRDPAYIYGPLSPRTIYVGIKFGNLL
jgi:outer membrane receptor for ferrienterochelin and colicins